MASRDLFARLRGQGWGQHGPAPSVDDGLLAGALPVLRALAAKPSTALRRWRPQDDVPLLVAVLRHTSPRAVSQSQTSASREAREDAALLALEALRRWAAVATAAAAPLALDVAWAAARAGGEAGAVALGGTASAAASPWRGTMIVHAAVRLWLVLAARADPQAGAVALQEAARLLTAPRSVEVLLGEGEGPWRETLGALLFLDAPAGASVAASLRYRAARLALDTVARAPALWAWDALAAVVGGAAASSMHHVGGTGGPADWRGALVQAALDAMEGDAVCPWAGHAAGAVAAAALLAQSAPGEGTADEEEDKRLWRAFPRLTQAMAPVTVERRWTATTPEEEVDWRTARVALARALMLLGLSGFCARSFRQAAAATATISHPRSAAAATSPPSSGGGWVPAQEWGACLTALLRLSVEEIVPSAAAVDPAGGPLARQRRHQSLAHALAERGLGPASSQEWARSLKDMFKAADTESQRAALVTLRTYSRSLAASASTASSTGQREGAYGAALVLQTCMVLADPSSAAVGSTEQATRVFEALEAISSMVALGAVGGGGGSETAGAGAVAVAGAGVGSGGGGGGASASAQELTLLRAAGNLQAVLEEDGEEGGLRNVRDWAMRELLQGKQQYGPPNAAQAENRLAFLIHLAFALCIETRRPAPHQYVADLTKFLLEQVAGDGTTAAASSSTGTGTGSGMGSGTGREGPAITAAGGSQAAAAAAVAAERRVQVLVHKCLRKLLANPHLLAYRAGRKEHWDEARRRVTATYIGAALTGYPVTTRFTDLAYSVGAALGAIPTAGDPAGQALLLHCIGLLQNRALDLILGGATGGDAQLHGGATVELVRLLFQTLIVCPPAILGAVLDGLRRDFFLRGLRGHPEARLRALRLFKDVVFGEVETMRQAQLAKWYLGLLDEEGSIEATASASAGAGASGGIAPHSRL